LIIFARKQWISLASDTGVFSLDETSVRNMTENMFRLLTRDIANLSNAITSSRNNEEHEKGIARKPNGEKKAFL